MQLSSLRCWIFSSGVGVNNAFESLPEIRELVRALQRARTKHLRADAGTRQEHEDVAAAAQARKDAADTRVAALVQRQLAVRQSNQVLGLMQHCSPVKRFVYSS